MLQALLDEVSVDALYISLTAEGDTAVAVAIASSGD